ncbi:MAG: carboxypeptidase-like regulatory domain-containing protein [bacterium]
MMKARNALVVALLVALMVSTFPPVRALAQEGEVCDADSPSPPGTDLVCQPTDDMDIVPGYVANAKKGDLLLSTSCGTIGGLLRRLSPPQRYSHEGIMTRNRFEVSHVTAAEERYYAFLRRNPIGNVLGIRPDVLKYGFPGKLVVSIQEAFEGGFVPDPEAGDKIWRIGGFNEDPVHCDGDRRISFPQVVKPLPDPNIETVEAFVRPRLHRVGDIARDTSRKHYRLFAYTRGNIAKLSDASFSIPLVDPATGRNWYRGTGSGVSSVYVWGVVKDAGIRLECENATCEDRDLSPADRAQGGQVDNETEDGLYLYDEVERQNAGEWLWRQLYEKALRTAHEDGVFGALLAEGAAERVASQVANCFANDLCDLVVDTHPRGFPGGDPGPRPVVPDPDAWRRPGIGRSVSPDDFLNWDSPSELSGAAYGFSEPLIFVPTRMERISRWQRVATTGSLTGTVFFRDVPAPRATVTIVGLGRSTRTNDAGVFEFHTVPVGRHEVEAYASVGRGGGIGVEPERATSRAVTSNRELVTVPSTTPIRLTLRDLGRDHRIVSIVGIVHITDFETFGGDERGTFFINQSILLSLTRRSQRFEWRRCVGDEVRVELDLLFELSPTPGDFSVSVLVRGILFEGTSCGTTDEDDRAVRVMRLAEDTSTPFRMRLYSEGDGEADISLTIDNRRDRL